MKCYVSHLESALDGTIFPAGQVHTIHQGRRCSYGTIWLQSRQP